MRNNVDVVFTGHAHDYERTDPINGVIYFVAGGAGADLTTPPGRSAFTAFSRSIHPLLLAKMEVNRLTIEAVDADVADGAVFDSVVRQFELRIEFLIVIPACARDSQQGTQAGIQRPST